MSDYRCIAGFYDGLTRDVQYEAFAGFYDEIFALYALKAELVADLACGTGTLTLMLSERGYDCIGIDASPDMLSIAFEKTAFMEKKPLFLCQRLEELDLYGTVDAAVCSLDGINHLPPESLDEVFKRVSLFLNPGGVFIFDILSPEALMGLDGEMFIDETEDLFCVWRCEYDAGESSCVYGFDFFVRSGEVWSRHSEEHVEYAYETGLIEKKLAENGFCDIKIFGDMRFSAPEKDEKRIFFAAKKKQ